MKIVLFFIFLSYSCFGYSQTNVNEDFVLKGIQAAKEQKYGLAISYLQFSLRDKDLPDSIKISGEFYLQYAYHNTNNPKFSIEKLDTIVPKYTNYNDSLAILFIKNISYHLSQNGYYNKALEYGNQTIKRIKKLYGSQSLAYANNLDNLALRYIDCNMLDSAMLKVQQAGIIIKQLKGKNDIDYAHNLNNLATIYNEKEQYKQAIKYRKKAINIVNKEKNEHLYAILLDNLGRDYWKNSEYQMGIKYNLQSLDILRKSNDNIYVNDYIIALQNLADKYSEIGEYDKANNYYNDALLKIKYLKGTDNLTYAIAMIKLAMNYWSIGEYNNFCNYSDSALMLMDNIYDNNDYEYLYYQRAVIEKYMQQEDFLNAKEKIKNVLEDEIELSTKDSIYYYSNLSTCYAKISLDYLTAFQFQNIAVNIANHYYNKKSKEGLIEFLKLKCNETKYLMGLFELHRNEPDEYKKRMESIRETIYLIVGLGEQRLDKASPLLVEFYILMINFHINLNELEDAYELCMSVLSETNLDTYSAVSLMNRLATISLLKEDYKSALLISKEIIYLLESEKGLKIDTYCSSLALLASCYIGNKQHDIAIETLNKRLSILNDNISIANYLDRNNEGIYTWWFMYVYLPTILYYSNYNGYSNITYNTVLNFKNIQSEITNKIIENSIYHESNDTYNKYVEFNNLNRKLNILIERGETNKKELNSIAKTIKQLEQDLLKESASFSNIQRLINLTWKDVQKGLHPNEISIEFVEVQDDKYIALLLKSDWKDVKALHITIPKDITSKDEAIKIWEPIKEYISPGDNIYFSASGILHQIPIESLPIGDGKIMSDVYNMYRLSSTRELVKEKKEVKFTKAALYGGLNYDMTDNELLSESQTYYKDASEEYFVSRGLLEDSIRGYKWDNLNNTLQEVNYISELMNKNQVTTQTYLGNKGNEESFKALSGHEYNIIHLATHGFFYPDEEAKEKDYFKPMLLNDNHRMFSEVDMSMWRSGLVMSGGNRAWKGDSIPDNVEDGILKAQEIGDLDLRGADLVVLSACNTGQGEVTGEGVFGLQRAFKMAGAQTIVMSLTPVDDQTTMAMMNKFYTNLFSGQSKHDAFYNAQRYIRSIKPDPKYWMGWIMLD